MTKEDEKVLSEIYDKFIDHIIWTRVAKAWVGVEKEKTKEFYEAIKKRRNPTFYDMVVDRIFRKPHLLISYNK